MQKIPITIALGEPKTDAFHHFILVGFTHDDVPADDSDTKMEVALIKSTNNADYLVAAMRVLANFLVDHEEQSAKIIGTAVLRTIDHGLEKLSGVKMSSSESAEG